jgi:FkbH-like protein
MTHQDGPPPVDPTGGPDALARLRTLARDGELARHYDEVPALLGRMDEADRARARTALSTVDIEAVRRRHPDVPVVSVAVTGHGTLTTLAAALTVALAGHGYAPAVHLSDFGSYVPDLADPASRLYGWQPDVTVCVLDHAAVLDEVPDPFTVADVERVFTEKVELWRGLARRFAGSGRGILVLNTVPLPKHVADQVLDLPSRARLGAVWRTANTALLGLATPSVVVLDLDPLLGAGVELVEPRFDAYAHVHLSAAVQTAYARELGHLVRAATGRGRKVLAVDLDETVWGGVLGDDGPDGIEVAGPGRGEAFHRFQLVLRQLRSQGVLLAAVSKNDRDAVLAAFREARGLALREDDFACLVANWEPKPGNLRAVAAALNLGADSIVFADDSPHERALVAAEVPEVVCLPLDSEPARHVRTLLADGWFTAVQLTGEDRQRTSRYREEAARSEYLASTPTPAEFLAGLGVEVEIGPVAAADVPRLSQLTLRTNQFNLTTRRLQQEDVRALAANPAAGVLAVRTRDRFGDNGLVGALVLRAESGALHIDNFVLSCRVFSRGIETACLAVVLDEARRGGYRAVHAVFRASAKNAKVRDLYPVHGFAPVEVTADRGRFVHDLADLPPQPPHLVVLRGSDLVPGVPGEGAVLTR